LLAAAAAAGYFAPNLALEHLADRRQSFPTLRQMRGG
jgi:hypothetical protein